MPYLIGALAAVATCTIALTARGVELAFPKPLRFLFVSLIGTMMGATFAPEQVSLLSQLWVSLLAMVLFVVLAHTLSFFIYTRLGSYDRVTATFAAMPGGLIEAVAIGTEAGADARVLSVQHFARIVIVVTVVPFLFWLWQGEAVGSAAGQVLSTAPPTVRDVALIAIVACAGLWLGPRLRLPAAHLTGPLLLSALLHGAGLLNVASPNWLLNGAQWGVGTGLGTMFGGATLALLARAFGFGLIVVAAVLVLSMIFALGLSQILPLPLDVLFISFAPGGVTEMGLIALSLGVSPLLVAIHHLFRILLMAMAAGYIARRMPQSN